ncbi:Prefoldin [Lipomyces tetrasporus]|uniref:Prefoldin n=1 Tax=Lipomyces tetrasporus TaxID=54092 RepID=A0AAD7QQQ8_9ASCO|nr:Prefoldin [Lipomyces tetrasporus]KAJ8099261.1 Prefoldin [Lipomyces tetrasporus]
MSNEQPKTVDLTTLSAQQLADVKSQLEQELEHLSQSFQKLRAAQAKFKECIGTVEKTFKGENKGKSILVPLTTSLYVPGVVEDVETVMVDVGTGYYIEKKPTDAIAFYENKVATLQKNLVDLEDIVNGKMGNLRMVEEVLRQKVMSSAPNVA